MARVDERNVKLFKELPHFVNPVLIDSHRWFFPVNPKCKCLLGMVIILDNFFWDLITFLILSAVTVKNYAYIFYSVLHMS